MLSRQVRVSFASVAMVACASASPLLVSHFDTSTDADYGVGGTVATDVGAPAITSINKFGGGALDLTSGTGATVKYSLANNLNIGKGTLEFWFNPQSAVAGSSSYLFSTVQDSGNRFYLKRSINTTSQQLFGGVLYVGGNTVSVSSGWKNIADYVQLNEWHHIALTWDLTHGAGSDNLSMYIDGSRASTFNAANDMATAWGAAPSTLNIGNYGGNAGFSDSYYDDLRVSDDVVYTGTSYTVPTAAFPIPEPSVLGLLGIVGGSLLWVRRFFLVG